MPDQSEYITRAEYNARHEELVARVSKTETLVEAWRQSLDTKFESINNRFDRVNDKVDASEKLLATKIDTLKDNLSKSSVSNFRWGISIAIAAIGSIASTLGILQVLHLLR